jgi:hypothetical protein
MNKWVLRFIIGIVCVFASLPAGAQQAPDVPPAVCQAIEQYVALINSAAANRDKALRQEQYSTALKALSAVLKQHSKEALTAPALEFAERTEDVACCDPGAAKFGDLAQKRLNAGAALQNICLPYTTSR